MPAKLLKEKKNDWKKNCYKNATSLSCTKCITEEGEKNHQQIFIHRERCFDTHTHNISDTNDRLWFVHKYIEALMWKSAWYWEKKEGISCSTIPPPVSPPLSPPVCFSVAVDPCRTQTYICTLILLLLAFLCYIFSIYMNRVLVFHFWYFFCCWLDCYLFAGPSLTNTSSHVHSALTSTTVCECVCVRVWNLLFALILYVSIFICYGLWI